MSRQQLWIEILPEQRLDYPYIPQNISLNAEKDVYNRNIARLVGSLAVLGRRLVDTDSIHKIKPDIRTISRIFDDNLLPDDFNVLTAYGPATKTKTSCIYGPHWLLGQETELMANLSDLRLYQQVIFLHVLPGNKWTILFASLTEGFVDGYFVGDFDILDIHPVVLKLSRALEKVSGRQFTFRRRLQIPSIFHTHAGWMAFLLAVHLHRHAKYLDLNRDRVMLHMLDFLDDFKTFHDNRWLGKLNVQNTTPSTHPFITNEYRGKDQLEKIEELGWANIDVVGDGNCGYYSLILGLENNDDFTFSLKRDLKGEADMRHHVPWQTKIWTLRRKLQKHSQLLLKVHYPRGEEPLDWWWAVGLHEDCTEEDRNQLSERFVCPNLPRSHYFAESFLEKTEYHMEPFWSFIVFASYMKYRIIMIMRNRTYSKKLKKDKDDWTTTIFKYNAPIDNHEEHIFFQQRPSLVRIPDTEFREQPTIEILLTIGYTKDGEALPQHFQFLRRVICDDVQVHTDPIADSLRDIVLANMENDPSTQVVHHGSDTGGGDTVEDNSVAARGTSRSTTSAADLADDESSNENIHEINPEKSVVDHVNTAHETPQQKTSSTSLVEDDFTDRMTTSRKQNDNRKMIGSESRRTKRKPKDKETSDTKWKRLKYLEKALDADFHRKVILVATKMRYDSACNKFLTKTVNIRGDGFTAAKVQEDVTGFDQRMVKAAMEYPGVWVGNSLGDPSDGDAPDHLRTKVRTIYQQHNRGFCLTYSLASALFYCGFDSAASILASQANFFANLHLEDALSKLNDLMSNLVPEIGRATIYGRRSKKAGRTLRRLTWEQLFSELVPHPTVIICRCPNGSTSHAFCAVDDLIFDSTTPLALKLQRESVQCIFNDCDVQIYQAFRFNMKVSPPGGKVLTQYKRQVTFNWVHP